MKQQEERGALRRAIKLELLKPLSEPWESAGRLLRGLAWMTPRLLNEALDAMTACRIAGRGAVKAAVAPDARAVTPEGLAYQAVNNKAAALCRWAADKATELEQPPKRVLAPPKTDEERECREDHERQRQATIKYLRALATLVVPGGVASAIARAAVQGYRRRDQAPPRFSGEVILVRAAETALAQDARGVVLTLALRGRSDSDQALPLRVRFAVMPSRGTHHETLQQLVSGSLAYSACKLKYDKRRKKWYALLSYEMPAPTALPGDPANVLAVHRGIRNALYAMSSTGCDASPVGGGKYAAQRRAFQARMRDVRRITAFERGAGATGHGTKRRYETYQVLGDKLARATHTFCQQMAAWVEATAARLGCGTVVIEDYGGIEPDKDPAKRRVLDRFPLHQMKQAISQRLERSGRVLREVPSAYISSTCPCCSNADVRQHNRQTDTFHCAVCAWERPADYVAAYWMLERTGADMSEWERWFARERALADAARQRKEQDDEQPEVETAAAAAAAAGARRGRKRRRPDADAGAGAGA